MASTNKTANYGLNQWVGTDPVLMADMNADNARIDAAIKALSDGMMKFAVGSYEGSGRCGMTVSGEPYSTPPTLSPGFKPEFVFVQSGSQKGYFFRPNDRGTYVDDSADCCSSALITEWGEGSVRWYHSNVNADMEGEYSLNKQGVTYSYIVVGG